VDGVFGVLDMPHPEALGRQRIAGNSQKDARETRQNRTQKL
jgi:hypothetical protein